MFSGRLAWTNRLSSWCAPTAGSSFCWTRPTWPWLSECQPPPPNRTGESASAMGMALAGGRRRHQSVPPRACGLLREAGKWTVTDRLTHVSSGDLSPSGPTERTGAGVRSNGRGGTRAGLLSRVCPGLRTWGSQVRRSFLFLYCSGWILLSSCPGSLLSESKVTWTLGMVRPFLSCMALTPSLPTAAQHPQPLLPVSSNGQAFSEQSQGPVARTCPLTANCAP